MKNSAFYKPNTVQIELVQGCNRRCSFVEPADLNTKSITSPSPSLRSSVSSSLRADTILAYCSLAMVNLLFIRSSIHV